MPLNRALLALAPLLIGAAAALPQPAPAPTVLVRPIASFKLTLIPPGKGGKPFGWIELLDSARKASGFIYLEDSDDDPHLGGGNSYIVTHLPYADLPGIVAILQSVKPMQIRYAGGASPDVFIESTAANAMQPELLQEVRAHRARVIAPGQ